MSMNTSSSSPQQPLRPVLLGFFIVGQLVFLFASNLLVFLLDPIYCPATRNLSPPLVSTLQLANDVTTGWSQTTGQKQVWLEFRAVAKRSAFLFVELRWDQTPNAARLSSYSEPVDSMHYCRSWDGARMTQYEETLVALPCWQWTPGEAAAKPDEYRLTMTLVVRFYVRIYQAYFEQRLREFQREHPELPPPDTLLLGAHVYDAPLPPGPRPFAWPPMREWWLVRWRLHAVPPAGMLPLERFDLPTQQFVAVAEQE
jgi:hypothetical protein